MRTRLEPWRHRLLAVVGAAPLICCGGTAFDSDDDAGNGGTSGASGSTSGGTSSGKGGAESRGGSGGSDGGSSSKGGSAGLGGEAASAGTAMGGGSAGGPVSHACLNPQPFDPSYDTGFEQCDGFIHRPTVNTCNLGLPRNDVWEPTEFDTCMTDADCADAPYGHCSVGAGQLPGRGCQYGCIEDSDCGPGSLCLCGAPVGHCFTTSCASDADCGPDFMCASYSGITCSLTGFACQTESDTCASNAECGFGHCGLSVNGYRECSPTCAVPGRPFLVGSEARLAADTKRGDWLEASEQPCLQELSPVERRELAAYWTRAGLMEHASIAAFARFTLGLLALGAPAELVQASNEACADETRHARLCFALASAYASEPRGPGPLNVGGALDDVSLATLLATTIREGCAGETLAAIEASEQAAQASDPVLQRVLSGIAADEARHAELAWRFVAWALDRGGPKLEQLARAEFERCLPAAVDPPTDAEIELERHGVLSASASRQLRQRALAEVVLPCASALLDRGDSAREPAPLHAHA